MTLRRTWLRPLIPVYTAALAIERSLHARGRLPARRLPDPVISVGSLSTGGAGKTPLVLALARALCKRDFAVRILTRGYGRKSKAVERVDPEGDPARFGDEPVLLAQRSGVPVFVGDDRYRAGLLAQELPATQRVVYLLDDGFQHRQLARDMDIVLLTRQDVDDLLLPAGNLREPLTRLNDADVIVVREEEQDALREFLKSTTERRQQPGGGSAPQPVVWVIRRRLELDPGDGAQTPKRPLIFSGIARPKNFTAMLVELGIPPAHVVAFPDHHVYSERDIDRLAKKAREIGAGGFITTEKDAVKLNSVMRSRLETVGPLLVPRLIVDLDLDLIDERAAVEQMIGKVSQMNRRRRVSST